MNSNTFLVIRILILLVGLTTFYGLWSFAHLIKKILAWLIFQISIVLLWLSASYVYYGQSNPIPQVVAFLILVFTAGILGIMLIFALGVSRRQDLWKIENRESKRSS